MSRYRARIARILGGSILNVAALGGLVCLVLVVLAFTLNISLIMFKTGSMSPTIPAGSLSMVREIPAAEIKVGDVVTVDRPAALPITHRVTSVAPGPADHERIITMKGDANEAEDPFPYTVESVRIVLASLPNLAHGVVWLSQPWVMAVLTIGSSALVTWAFWPRERSAEDRRAHEVPFALPEQSDRGPQLGVTLLAIPLAMGIGVLDPEPIVTENLVVSGHLKIFTIGDNKAMFQLAPGEPVQWQVGVTASTPEPGEIRIDLVGSGNKNLGLKAAIRSCDQRWVKGHCGGHAVQIQETEPVDVGGTRRELTAMTTEEERWLLFDFSIPDGDSAEQTNRPVRLQVHASGAGADVSASPGPVGALPPTGANLLVALANGIGAIVLGIIFAGIAKKRRLRSQ